MSDVFAPLLADLVYSGEWEGAVEMRTEHGWVDVLDRVIELRADLRAKVDALDHAWDCDADKPRGAGMPCDCPIKAVIALFDGGSDE